MILRSNVCMYSSMFVCVRMYVCMYVGMYVCIMYVFLYTLTNVWSKRGNQWLRVTFEAFLSVSEVFAVISTGVPFGTVPLALKQRCLLVPAP